jgi:hypothetical protein
MNSLFAYLDAGTGSILLQALMGGFAGFVVVSKLAWQSFTKRRHQAADRVETAA